MKSLAAAVLVLAFATQPASGLFCYLEKEGGSTGLVPLEDAKVCAKGRLDPKTAAAARSQLKQADIWQNPKRLLKSGTCDYIAIRAEQRQKFVNHPSLRGEKVTCRRPKK